MVQQPKRSAEQQRTTANKRSQEELRHFTESWCALCVKCALTAAQLPNSGCFLYSALLLYRGQRQIYYTFIDGLAEKYNHKCHPLTSLVQVCFCGELCLPWKENKSTMILLPHKLPECTMQYLTVTGYGPYKIKLFICLLQYNVKTLMEI